MPKIPKIRIENKEKAEVKQVPETQIEGNGECDLTEQRDFGDIPEKNEPRKQSTDNRTENNMTVDDQEHGNTPPEEIPPPHTDDRQDAKPKLHEYTLSQ
jgi:hypothetical protein